MKRKKARKTKSEQDRRSQVFQLRLNPVEHKTLHERAAEMDVSVSAFIRARIFPNEEAKEVAV